MPKWFQLDALQRRKDKVGRKLPADEREWTRQRMIILLLCMLAGIVQSAKPLAQGCWVGNAVPPATRPWRFCQHLLWMRDGARRRQKMEASSSTSLKKMRLAVSALWWRTKQVSAVRAWAGWGKQQSSNISLLPASEAWTCAQVHCQPAFSQWCCKPVCFLLLDVL